MALDDIFSKEYLGTATWPQSGVVYRAYEAIWLDTGEAAQLGWDRSGAVLLTDKGPIRAGLKIARLYYASCDQRDGVAHLVRDAETKEWRVVTSS